MTKILTVEYYRTNGTLAVSADIRVTDEVAGMQRLNELVQHEEGLDTKVVSIREVK
jgi:hypothetical protein